MKKCIFLILALFFILAVSHKNVIYASVTKTSGNLVLTLDNDPLFGSGITWAPSDSRSADFSVQNKSAEKQTIQVEALNTSHTGNLDSAINIKFSEKGPPMIGLYGKDDDTSLNKFWGDREVILSDTAAGETKTYTMTVTFKSDSNNDYQNKKADFDLRIGFKSGEGITLGLSTVKTKSKLGSSGLIESAEASPPAEPATTSAGILGTDILGGSNFRWLYLLLLIPLLLLLIYLRRRVRK